MLQFHGIKAGINVVRYRRLCQETGRTVKDALDFLNTRQAKTIANVFGVSKTVADEICEIRKTGMEFAFESDIQEALKYSQRKTESFLAKVMDHLDKPSGTKKEALAKRMKKAFRPTPFENLKEDVQNVVSVGISKGAVHWAKVCVRSGCLLERDTIVFPFIRPRVGLGQKEQEMLTNPSVMSLVADAIPDGDVYLVETRNWRRRLDKSNMQWILEQSKIGCLLSAFLVGRVRHQLKFVASSKQMSELEYLRQFSDFSVYSVDLPSTCQLFGLNISEDAAEDCVEVTGKFLDGLETLPLSGFFVEVSESASAAPGDHKVYDHFTGIAYLQALLYLDVLSYLKERAKFEEDVETETPKGERDDFPQINV